MTYYWGILNEAVVFQFWKPDDAGTTVATCFMAIAFVIILDLIKLIRHKYFNIAHLKYETNFAKQLFDVKHIVNCLLYGFQMFISYTLMLAVMLYNLYLIIAICFGFALSRWITATSFMSEVERGNNEGDADSLVRENNGEQECC